MENNKIQSSVLNLYEEIPGDELKEPNLQTIFKIVWYSIRNFLKERAGIIILSSLILIILWGYHGELELLKYFWDGWSGPGKDLGNRTQIIPGIPWDQELISFWAGCFLLVVIPILIIKFHFKQSLSAYGFGLPPKGRRLLALWSFLTLMAICIPIFWFGTKDAGMQETYPFFRPFSGSWDFVLYELAYLPFFIAIEFIFRGYLLFGLAGIRDDEIPDGGGGVSGVFYFHRYALLIQMLSYTAWHLGKPIPELMGTMFWGLAVGALAIVIRSVWPIILSHWLLNVLIDSVISVNNNLIK